jgi:hypothetical protein
MLGQNPFTQEDYDSACQQVCQEHWLVFEAEQWDVKKGCYYPRCRFCVDNHLFVKIVDVDDESIYTCYHDHWHSAGRHDGHEKSQSVLQRQERYVQSLCNMILGGQFRNVTVVMNKGPTLPCDI